MNKIGLIFSIILLQIQPAYTKEICDCFGECIPVNSRDVSSQTKVLVKNKYGYPKYARMEIDHRIPLCLGGSNLVENLQPLSSADHKKKTEHDLMLLYYVKGCFMTIKEAQSEVDKWR